jgi:hypothetical protein
MTRMRRFRPFADDDLTAAQPWQREPLLMPRCGRPPSASRPAVHADGSTLSSKTERPFLRKDW